MFDILNFWVEMTVEQKGTSVWNHSLGADCILLFSVTTIYLTPFSLVPCFSCVLYRSAVTLLFPGIICTDKVELVPYGFNHHTGIFHILFVKLAYQPTSSSMAFSLLYPLRFVSIYSSHMEFITSFSPLFHLPFGISLLL